MTFFPDARTGRMLELCRAHLREPDTITLDAEGLPVLTFEPPLTTEEQATFDAILVLVDSPVALAPDEYRAVRPHVQSLRDFRQLGRNAFMALTAAERDRMLYDAQTATTIVLLALLRD